AIEYDHLACEAWMGLAGLCAHRAEWSEALRCLATVLAIEPEHIEAHFRAGQVLVELGDHARAMTHLEVVLNNTPGDVEALCLRAKALFHLGEYGPCLADCEQAIRLQDSVGLARLYRALARLELGARPDAGLLDDLHRARSMAP